MEKKTQKELILDYLRRHGSITPDEARLYCRKCERLAARISELREKGYNIITDNVDADGNTVNYAIYRLQPHTTPVIARVGNAAPGVPSPRHCEGAARGNPFPQKSPRIYEGKRSAVAVVNDSPVDCQSRDRASPQRGGPQGRGESVAPSAAGVSSQSTPEVTADG